MRISEREMHPVEILEPKMKGQVCMQASKVKNIYKQTKNEPTIRFLYETNKTQKQYIHSRVSHISNNIEYTSMEATTRAIIINEIIINGNIQFKTRNNEIRPERI